jgi:integrase
MASIRKQKSGHWRAQVRRKGRSLSETFLGYEDAKRWAADAERKIDRGETPSSPRIAKLRTFSDLIDLHISDLQAVDKSVGRTKSATLAMLKRELGRKTIAELDRERLIQFGRSRAGAGAGPVTLSMYLGEIKTVISHAAAVHGVSASAEPIDHARVALKRLGLVGKSIERDRRPEDEELQRLFDSFDANDRSTIPMTRIVKFAIASAMRQEEICRITWDDFNVRTKVVTVRDRKDPRQKKGNDQRVPMLAVSGFDAIALIEQQREGRTNRDQRIFPYNSRSVGAAFRRACKDLKIADLHFHDLRHEATSRLFEVGFAIHEVALVTGHKDWKMLKRYTHLKPEALHTIAERRMA